MPTSEGLIMLFPCWSEFATPTVTFIPNLNQRGVERKYKTFQTGSGDPVQLGVEWVYIKLRVKRKDVWHILCNKTNPRFRTYFLQKPKLLRLQSDK